MRKVILSRIDLHGTHPLPLRRFCGIALLLLTVLASSSTLFLRAKPTPALPATAASGLQSSTSTSQDATNAPFSGVAIPASLFGLHIVNGNYPTVPFSLLRTTGLSWTHLEPTRGTFDWSGLDALVNLALSHNLTVLYTTDKVPSWAAKDTKTCAPTYSGSPYVSCSSGVANLADWDGFVTALVQRYQGKIAVYELWNEPDQDFSGPMSDFVPLAQHFHDLIRANDAAALVAAPAVVTVSWLDTFWAAGGVTDVDSVDFHGYLSSSAPAPENLASQKVTPLNAITAKYGLSAKPVWDSEGSWGDPNSLTDLQAQAAFVARYYLLHWSNGISRFYWYSWDDNGSGPGSVGWGSLFNPTTKQALPAATAYAQIYNWMVGSTMTQLCAASNSIWTCGFTTSLGGTALAVWNPAATIAYPVSLPFTQYQDLAGNTTQITGSSVNIGPAPILLIAPSNQPPPTMVYALELSPAGVTGGSSSQGTITLTAAAPFGGAVVTLSSSNTSVATVPASVTVAAGATTASFTIQTISVANTTNVTISASLFGTQTATLTLSPPSIASLALNPTGVTGGSSSLGAVTLSAAAPSGGAVVALSSSNTAVATVPASVTVVAGATGATFTVKTIPVANSTNVTVSASCRGTMQTTSLNLTPPSISSLTLSPTSVSGGASSQAIVKLSGAAPSGGAVIALSSSNTVVATVPASVTIAAGSTSATFTVKTSSAANSTTVTISVSYSSSTQTAALTLLPPSVSSVTLNPANITGGSASQGTVKLSSTAPSGGTVVTLSSNNTAVATLPASVTAAAGATSATFTVQTSSVSNTTNVTITASGGGTAQKATLSVSRQKTK